jgi:hypothetical protein
MAQTSYPFENTDTTEAQFSQLFRRIQNNGVWGSPSTTDVKVTGDSTGMNAKVAAGYAMVRGHFYYNSASVTMTIGASNTNPRIDLIVLRLDVTANTIVLAVVAGTASATPAAPSLTQTDEGTYELEIGRVLIPANATTIAPADVSDTRPFMGKQFGVWTTTGRPSSPLVGQAGLNTTLGVPEFYTGSAWSVFTPAVTASVISSAEQANISAGKLRSGGVSGGTAVRVYIQSGQPYANGAAGGVAGDLWFW